MIDVGIAGAGNGKPAKVDDDQALRVCEYPPDLQPLGTRSRYRYITGVAGSTGLDSGTTNMNVDGSGTPQEFYIGSSPDYDIHVMGVSILIADTAVSHQNFGTLSALNTGWDLKLREAGEITFLVNKAQTNGQVIVYTGHDRPFGDGATSWELTNWTATEDAIITFYDFEKYIPGGLRIGRGTQDRLISVVNDDLTGLQDFQVRIFGYRHYPIGK